MQTLQPLSASAWATITPARTQLGANKARDLQPSFPNCVIRALPCGPADFRNDFRHPRWPPLSTFQGKYLMLQDQGIKHREKIKSWRYTLGNHLYWTLWLWAMNIKWDFHLVFEKRRSIQENSDMRGILKNTPVFRLAYRLCLPYYKKNKKYF